MIFNRFSRRERWAVFAAIGFMGLVFVVNWIVIPSVQARKRLERNLLVKRQSLSEMLDLQLRYAALQDRAEEQRMRITRRAKGFTLFSFMDTLAGEVGIKSNIAFMKQSSSMSRDRKHKISTVEMKLDKITLKQLVAYMHGVETSPNQVTLKRVSISKERPEAHAVTAVLQAVTTEI